MPAGLLREELGVAISGVKADVAGFKLWQSTDPNVFLFTRDQPALAKGANGRYQVAVSTYRTQDPARGSVITGGSAVFTVTAAVQYDADKFQELMQAFQTGVVAKGAPDRPYKFIPLNTRKGLAEVLINPVAGTQQESFNGKDVGTPGGNMTFLVDLTELGAQEWAQGIREHKQIAAGVKYQYEYLAYVPPCSATVTLNGATAFRHLSTELNASAKFGWYGGSAKINTEWENMTRNGAIEITFSGGGLSPELEKIRTDLTLAFANQAREQWFKMLFEPAPTVDPAKAGDTGGLFGGANFALKWKSESEAVNLSQTITFQGWNWLTTSADADITTMFASLDDSYLNEVATESTFPVTMTVDSDPLFEHASVSMSFSQGRWPETKVYGSTGGTDTYNLTTAKPDDVEVSYVAEVNFTPSKWPPIKASGKGKGADGRGQIVKPSSWVGRHMIYLFVKDENGDIRPPLPDDQVVVNVSYSGPHLPAPVTSSARLGALEPVEFSYPLDPNGAKGTPMFSAFGVIDGKPVMTRQAPISLEEEAVFILADSKGIKAVSLAAVTGEEADPLADRLLKAQGRPVISRPSEEATVPAKGTKGAKGGTAKPGTGPTVTTTGSGTASGTTSTTSGTGGANGTNGTAASNGHVHGEDSDSVGHVRAVESTPDGLVLLVDVDGGTEVRVVGLQSASFAHDV